jgi:hypothetical protein
MAKIEWTEVTDPLDAFTEVLSDGCECALKDDPRCTLDIEEGQASLRHDACGRPLWLDREDIFAEFPVNVTIETCSNPGGWHGMERCDCGPEVAIEHAERL